MTFQKILLNLAIFSFSGWMGCIVQTGRNEDEDIYHRNENVAKQLKPDTCSNCDLRNWSIEPVSDDLYFFVAEFVPPGTPPPAKREGLYFSTIENSPKEPATVITGFFSRKAQLLAKERRPEIQHVVYTSENKNSGSQMITLLGRGQNGEGVVLGIDVSKHSQILTPAISITVPANCIGLPPGAKTCSLTGATVFSKEFIRVTALVERLDGKSGFREFIFNGEGKLLRHHDDWDVTTTP